MWFCLLLMSKAKHVQDYQEIEMGKKTKTEELVRVIVDPADSFKDQQIPRSALQHYIVSGAVVRDLTNDAWCTKNGKPLPFKR